MKLFPNPEGQTDFVQIRGFWSDNVGKHLVTLLCNCCWETLKIWEGKKIPTCFSLRPSPAPFASCWNFTRIWAKTKETGVLCVMGGGHLDEIQGGCFFKDCLCVWACVCVYKVFSNSSAGSSVKSWGELDGANSFSYHQSSNRIFHQLKTVIFFFFFFYGGMLHELLLFLFFCFGDITVVCS